jgi:hypothetical protein
VLAEAKFPYSPNRQEPPINFLVSPEHNQKPMASLLARLFPEPCLPVQRHGQWRRSFDIGAWLKNQETLTIRGHVVRCVGKEAGVVTVVNNSRGVSNSNLPAETRTPTAMILSLTAFK